MKTGFKWWVFAIVCVLVLGIWWLNPFIVARCFPHGADKWSAAEFGDQFGVVNALFSGLAFAAVFFALLAQRDQLKMQQEELTLQREEFRESREAQQASADALRRRLEQEENLERRRFTMSVVDRWYAVRKSPKSIFDEPEEHKEVKHESRTAIMYYFFDLAELVDRNLVDQDLVCACLGQDLATWSARRYGMLKPTLHFQRIARILSPLKRGLPVDDGGSVVPPGGAQ